MKDSLQPLAKKARKVSSQEWSAEAWDEAEYGSEDATVSTEIKAKEQRTDEPSIADLEPGAVVTVAGWADWRGVIRDAFEAIDEFWIADEESGELTRDENGDVINFKSSELSLVARPPIMPPNPKQAGPPGGVLIVGTEQQMTKVLNHFGTPDATVRSQPQMLLAFPLGKECQADKILTLSRQGVTDEVMKLGQELRPDVHVALRAYHLKHAVNELGPDVLRMEKFYMMSSVSLPYSWEDIDAVKGWQRKWRREVCCQIDLGPTARGLAQPEDSTPEDTARRALGQELGVDVSLVLWDEQVQSTLRQNLDVDLPLQFMDVNGGRITVVLLPSDALVHLEDGVLCFTESPDADYLAEGVIPAGEAEAADEVVDADASESEESKPAANAGPQGKTIAQWEKEQAQFAHLPKIPPDWVRVISQKTGEVYFFNKKTQEASFDIPRPEAPLPAGWTKQVSKTTGKTYYWHAVRKESKFERPTE